jgi:hypothetical protein
MHSATQPTHATRATQATRAALELAIIATLYLAYRFGRLIGVGREEVARSHAEIVRRVQDALHLPSEAAMQDVVASIPHVYEIANRYYVTLHFPVIVAFLLWGFLARPRADYVWARNLLIVQTAAALLIHIAFPLAPPRMFPQWGFVDTMAVFGPNAYAGASASVANQYAAMPSLHIGWAVLIAVVLVRTAPRPVAAVGVAHAIVTVLVVVITANHWLLDGMVAIALLGVAMLLFPAPSRYRIALRRPAR